MKKTETKNYDVVVCGGGMSGVCAALASARKGAKTVLVHARPVLGGNASGEIRIHISGASESSKKPELEEGGIIHELMLENKACNPYFSYPIWETVLFSKVRYQPNLDLFLNTVMYDAKSENSRITEIYCYQETTEKHITLTAPLFVDATGNGTLGYFADAEYMTGSESRAETGEPNAPDAPNNNRMGNSILFRAVDRHEPVKFTPPAFAKKITEEDLKLRVHCSKLPDFSSAENPEEYKRISAFSSKGIDYGYWWIELTGKGDDIISEYEEIRDDLYAYFYGIWDHIKNGGEHGAENYDLEWVGMLPGMRESRRLRGDYLLNENDIIGNRVFDDAVCVGGWGVDLHAPNGLLDKDILPSVVWSFPGSYTIPYRSYYSSNIDNLFMSGRNISATKLGMASSRVIGTCAAGGQAVGTAAAMCIKKGLLPRGLSEHISELQQQLLKDDCFIPGFKNNDADDKAKTAHFTASSYIGGCEPDNVRNGISRSIDGACNCWRCENAVNAYIRAELSKPELLSEIRLTFDSNFDYPIRITMSPARQNQQRRGVPPELVRDYDVVLLKNGKEVATHSVRDNKQRLSVCDFEPTLCDAFEIRVKSTNGEKSLCIYEIRAY